MQTRMRLTVPDDTDATLTVTMTVKEWKQFRGQLQGTTWPSSRFADAIADIIEKAEKTVWENVE